ncbi:hypothetical protein AFERRID_29780 [Acidithiobacillus ferridurans]|jgi:hypothetical protein|uniref:Uncharacterized protein n=2 Tax=Acidithiobacillus ferridurans TaxID=1232575 RepID=A0A2Z6IM20_ACIFI|nr:hypothetical protein AFERRID_29780 [Acidithiobacillus ferridurans]
MDLRHNVEMEQQQIVISATIYPDAHMVGATTKICYDTFHMKVGMKCNHVVIFASVSWLWLIVIHKSKD